MFWDADKRYESRDAPTLVELKGPQANRTNMAKKQFDNKQSQVLLEHAKNLIAAFVKGVVDRGEFTPHDWENGWGMFDGYYVRYSEEFIESSRAFTLLAAKMLKAKSAHERTISAMCRKASQEYVKELAEKQGIATNATDSAAKDLVDQVLAEAGKEYVHIEPNFLIRHGVPDVILLGRVRSMRTELLAANTAIKDHKNIHFEVGGYPSQRYSEDGITFCMPGSVWVVEVAAAKENSAEEAKWLIDVAVSFMRLTIKGWSGVAPGIGQQEANSIYPTIHSQPRLTIDGSTVTGGLGVKYGWYETSAQVSQALTDPALRKRAADLFDPVDKSLAQRVAQGLGWLTRGRQQADRAERLLSFFTALEALLSSDDKSAPITQTISRHVSVICTHNISERIAIFNLIKGLYNVRSAVVHTGQREVLWQDANNLQLYAETVFQLVLAWCDLSMTQECFRQSLADASHGMKWGFAPDQDK
ncbi:MAG: hypothetical protein ACT4PZ_09125 [Panacagrimonas sp.]